jgi:O-phosphoseryl-tRNA synthetase
MKFDPEEIKKELERDPESAWLEGRRYVYHRVGECYPGLSFVFGKPHPVFDTIQRLRNAYMRIGFEEVMNPLIVEDEDVYKQFGKEAPAVLDRCFYLAGMERPNVGISGEKIVKLEELLDFSLRDDDVESLRRIFHRFKKGEIEGDDLVGEIAAELSIPDFKVVRIFDVFPEFTSQMAVPNKKILRSHMTSGWFITLRAVWDKKPLPIKLFSVDRCFRREQREDEERLMNYHSASCVIVDEEVGIEHGKAITDALLSQFGFSRIRFQLDKKRSKYYVPGTQMEVFIRYKSNYVEVATFGVYSPTALAQYDIAYPVMNLGLGVERLAMILYDKSDIRRLSYGQFYELEMSDIDIARLIRVDRMPKTNEGYEILEAITKVCEENGKEKSPCEFEACRGELSGKNIVVYVTEKEENTMLCGPAYLNDITVHNGDVIGVPTSNNDTGISTGIRYIDAFASLAASEIEFSAQNGEDKKIRVRIVRSPADINIRIDPVARKYITDHKNKIDIRGPFFTTVRMEILS